MALAKTKFKKSEMNDMASISNMTPRLDNQKSTTRTRTENNSELKKVPKGINQVRDTGRDLKMRGPSKAGSNMNLINRPSSPKGINLDNQIKLASQISSSAPKNNFLQTFSNKKEDDLEIELANTEFMADQEPSETEQTIIPKQQDGFINEEDEPIFLKGT